MGKQLPAGSVHVVLSMICGSTMQVDLWTNFRDYGLRSPVGLLRADAHTMPFRCGAAMLWTVANQ